MSRHSHLRSKYFILPQAIFHCEAISFAEGEFHCVKETFTLILILPQTVAQIGMEVDSHYKISFNYLMKSILQSTVGRVVELSFQTER